MSGTLLQTKLYVPKLRPFFVPRPHLIEKLNRGIQQDCKLTLISAPAGFGKTTLVSGWINDLQLTIDDLQAEAAGQERIVNPKSKIANHFAWLSLDGYDDDPNQFWQYVLAALKTAVPHLGASTQPLLSANPLPPPPILLTGLLNELADLPQKVILVLDDYHVIADKRIHEGLDYLLDHAPYQLHLVLLTRADPLLALSRLRARGQLHELRLADLRFTETETAVFLTELMDLPLSTQDVTALVARTEGWIAGLQLTAVSLQGHPDKSRFIQNFSGSHQFILEYLTEEVLQQQPGTVKTFLLQTSILSRLCAPLCDAVTGRDDSQAILSQLVRQNLFITALDDSHHWFRTHQLLAELLSTHLKYTASPTDIRALHDRASRWCEEHGAWETAVSHAIETGEWGRVADLVTKAYHRLIAQGRVATWQRWLAQIPAQIVQIRPALLVRQGWAAFLNGQLPQAENMLLSAREQLLRAETSPEQESLRGELATYLATIAFFREDPAQIIQAAEEALTFLPPEALAQRARAIGALGLGVSLAGNPRRAMRLFHESADLAQQANNPFLLAHALEVVADGQFQSGRLRAAAQTCQEIIELGSKDRPVPLPFAGNGYVKLASIYLEWGELAQADEAMAEGLALSEQGGIGYNLLPATCTQIRLQQALGDEEGALAALQQAEAMVRHRPSKIAIVQLSAYAVQFWLLAGDVSMAASWATGEYLLSEPLSLADLPIIVREVMQVAQARVYLAQNRPDAVLAIHEKLYETARFARRLARVIEIGLLAALAYQMKGETAVALDILQSTLNHTRPEGYVQIFVECGQLMRHLLHQLPLTQQTGYVQKLRQSFPTTAQSSVSPLVEPLSPRELEVLHLIVAGLSNKQIAEELIVSLNTVKKHTTHIYGKLGVNGRTQAIACARELELL